MLVPKEMVVSSAFYDKQKSVYLQPFSC